MRVKRQIERKSTRNNPFSIFAALIFRKANLLLWGNQSKLFRGIQAFDFTLTEMHVHWMCVRVLRVEKSSSELEESLRSIRFCKEIERNSVEIERKRRTAEGWPISEKNLSKSNNRQWHHCHNNRDSHLNWEWVEKFFLQSTLHWTLARIS